MKRTWPLLALALSSTSAAAQQAQSPGLPTVQEALALMKSQTPSLSLETAYEQALDKWVSETGVILTAEARAHAASTVGNLGWWTWARTSGSQNMASAQQSLAQAGFWIFPGWGQSGGNAAGSPPPVSNSGSTAGLIFRFPEITIIVTPAPPRDYQLQINKRSYRATEKSVYGVSRGPVAIEIMRPGKPPCTWTKVVSTDEVIRCQL